MKQRIFIIIIFICFFLLWAAAGEALNVKGDIVNIRSGPSTEDPIILQVERGQTLFEIGREGEWIEVGIMGTGGKTGWIHSSLVSEASISPLKRKESDSFKRFKTTFDLLNENVKTTTGVTLFTNAQEMGDGIIHVTATDTWLAAPLSSRKENLRTIFDMWDAAEDTDLPIAVYILDQSGQVRMKMSR
jgi:uncharacterized protein YgiM (DUF1202 family)